MERCHRLALGHRGRFREGRAGGRERDLRRAQSRTLRRHRRREMDRRRVDRLRDGPAPLDPVTVPPRRAGCAAVHGEDHRVGAVVRRQAVRRHAGRRRGPPRRGLRALPAREGRRRVPGQCPPPVAPRRHHQRQQMGHDLPRHAGDGRGVGARRLRVHASTHERTAAQAATALRDERRGPPRRLRSVSRCARSTPG